MPKHNSEIPSVIGFFRRDSQASTGSGSRRNSELEMQHQYSLNEAELENRRQRKSLRQFQRRNTQNTSMEDTIPEVDSASAAETSNNTRL